MVERKTYPIIKYNEFGKEIYREAANGHWEKRKYDEQGRQIYWETNSGAWAKHKFDEFGNEIYYENSAGYWYKREYNEHGFMTYYEDSSGNIRGQKRLDFLISDASEKSTQISYIDQDNRKMNSDFLKE